MELGTEKERRKIKQELKLNLQNVKNRRPILGGGGANFEKVSGLRNRVWPEIRRRQSIGHCPGR